MLAMIIGLNPKSIVNCCTRWCQESILIWKQVLNGTVMEELFCLCCQVKKKLDLSGHLEQPCCPTVVQPEIVCYSMSPSQGDLCPVLKNGHLVVSILLDMTLINTSQNYQFLFWKLAVSLQKTVRNNTDSTICISSLTAGLFSQYLIQFYSIFGCSALQSPLFLFSLSIISCFVIRFK